MIWLTKKSVPCPKSKASADSRRAAPKYGLEADFVLEGNVELLRDYMREGVGVSFVLASVEAAYSDMRSIPLADEIGAVSIYLSWCGDRYLTNSMLTLQRYLNEVGKNIEAEQK